MILIDGKAVAAAVKLEQKARVDALKLSGKSCGLAVIIVGEDPASKVYVRNKMISCGEVGIESYSYELPGNTQEDEIINIINKLNNISLNKENY